MNIFKLLGFIFQHDKYDRKSSLRSQTLFKGTRDSWDERFGKCLFPVGLLKPGCALRSPGSTLGISDLIAGLGH